jgi:hypothetical protein
MSSHERKTTILGTDDEFQSTASTLLKSSTGGPAKTTESGAPHTLNLDPSHTTIVRYEDDNELTITGTQEQLKRVFQGRHEWLAYLKQEKRSLLRSLCFILLWYG